jgi:hypothetical protein
MQEDADQQQNSMRREEWDTQREQYHQFASQMRVCPPLPLSSCLLACPKTNLGLTNSSQTKYDLAPQEPKDTV